MNIAELWSNIFAFKDSRRPAVTSIKQPDTSINPRPYPFHVIFYKEMFQPDPLKQQYKGFHFNNSCLLLFLLNKWSSLLHLFSLAMAITDSWGKSSWCIMWKSFQGVIITRSGPRRWDGNATRQRNSRNSLTPDEILQQELRLRALTRANYERLKLLAFRYDPNEGYYEQQLNCIGEMEQEFAVEICKNRLDQFSVTPEPLKSLPNGVSDDSKHFLKDFSLSQLLCHVVIWS